jgi:hypothetical protein
MIESLHIPVTVADPKGGNERMRLQSRITTAIRDEDGNSYEQIRREILGTQEIGDIGSAEAVQLLDHLEALRTKDQETRLRILLATDSEFLKKRMPYEYETALMQDKFRRDNGRDRSCAHLQLDTFNRCAKCLKGTQEGCTEICPARRTSVVVPEREKMVA